MKIVVTLGDTATELLEIVKETAKLITDLIEAGYQVLLVHGRG